MRIPRVEEVLEVMKAKSYSVYEEGNYNLNIVGIRSNIRTANEFDDFITVFFPYDDSLICRIYPATTDPGSYYLQDKILNPAGCAILKAGQYKSTYSIGIHNNSYEALVQTKPVKVYRDNNKDNILNLNENCLQQGLFGINIHRSVKIGAARKVDNFSAGCQVFKNFYDFNEFMSLCYKARDRYGNSFTYTLLDEADFS